MNPPDTPPEAEAEPGPGSAIGPYQVLSLVGAGPTGRVYLAARKALDAADGRTSLGPPRAVKVIHGYLLANPLVREQLHTELQTAAVLRHEAAVKLIEASLDSEPPWVAMEHVPGPTLWDRVRRLGPLEGEELVDLARGLAGVLDSMNAVGLVHRQVHPRNVVLSPTGARLVDVGVSFLTHHSVSTGRTEPSVVSDLLAPELVAGIAPGPPADVYGWGVTVAFAACGQLPDVGAEWDLTSVPEEFQDLVRRALSRAVQTRPTAAEILAALVSPGLDHGPDTSAVQPYASELKPNAAVATSERDELARLVPAESSPVEPAIAATLATGAAGSLGALTAFGTRPVDAPPSPGSNGSDRGADSEAKPAEATPMPASVAPAPRPEPVPESARVPPRPATKNPKPRRRSRRWFPALMALLLTLSLGTIALVLLASGDDDNDDSLLTQQADNTPEVENADDATQATGDDDGQAGEDDTETAADQSPEGDEAEAEPEPEVEVPSGICPDPGSLDWPNTTLGPALSCPSYPAGIPTRARSEPGQGWIAILSALPIEDPDRVDTRAGELEALIEENEERSVSVGLYDTRHFSGLRDPFWVLFAGPFPSEAEAVEYCETHPYLNFCVPRELGESGI